MIVSGRTALVESAVTVTEPLYVPGFVPYSTDTSIDSGWFCCSAGCGLPSQGMRASGTTEEPKRTKCRKRNWRPIGPSRRTSAASPTRFAFETTISAASSPPTGSFSVIERLLPNGSLPLAGIVCADG